MNRHCSGYRLACPVLISRPWGPDREWDADDQPCEALVHVTLDGERGTDNLWIEDYDSECGHEFEDLTVAQQEQMTKRAIEESRDQAMDRLARG